MVWTPAQTGAFLDAAQADRLYPPYHLAAFTGLRRAELAGLPWSETDLEKAGLITVRETRPDVKCSPKSEARERTVALSADTVALLRAWRRRQRTERLAWGEDGPTAAWSSPRGGQPIRPAYLSEYFRLWSAGRAAACPAP